MKKNNLFKAVGIVILAYIIVSWLVPVIYNIAGVEGDVEYQIGLTSFLAVITETFSGFGGTILYILLVGGFYGVLKSVGAYDKIIDLLALKAKGREKLFLVTTVVTMAIISSISGLDLGLLIVYPILIALFVKVGYDKLVALSATVGATIVGMYGATFAGTLYGLNEQVLGLDSGDQLLFKAILFVVGLIALLVFILLYCDKNNLVFDNKKEALVKKWSFEPFVLLSVILCVTIGAALTGVIYEVYNMITNGTKFVSGLFEMILFVVALVLQILVARKWLPKREKKNKVFASKKADNVKVKKLTKSVNKNNKNSKNNKKNDKKNDKKKDKKVDKKVDKKSEVKEEALVKEENKGKNYILPIVIFTILFVLLGALFAGSLYGFNGEVVELSAANQMVIEAIVLVVLVAALAIVVKFMNPNKNEDKTATPGLIVLGSLSVIFFLGTTAWAAIFKSNFFDTIHNTWIGFKVGGFDILNKIFGGAQALPAFGTWNTPYRFAHYSILLVVAMVILGICYKKKAGEVFEGFVDGIKSFVVPTIIAVLVCSVFVFVYYYPVLTTVSSLLLEVTDKFNVALTGIFAMINSFFYVDYYYLSNAVLYNMPSIYEDKEVLSIISIMFTNLYSLIMLVSPTSLLLLISLWISEVNYTTWFKFIWKLALALLLVSFVVFMILLLI